MLTVAQENSWLAPRTLGELQQQATLTTGRCAWRCNGPRARRSCPKLLAARFRRASAILRPRHLRARSGGELETMPNELSSETEKTAGEESGSGEGGAESARDELGALAGLKPGGLTSAQEVQTTLLGGANCEP
jgi:hypothetical protein